MPLDFRLEMEQRYNGLRWSIANIAGSVDSQISAATPPVSYGGIDVQRLPSSHDPTGWEI